MSEKVSLVIIRKAKDVVPNYGIRSQNQDRNGVVPVLYISVKISDLISVLWVFHLLLSVAADSARSSKTSSKVHELRFYVPIETFGDCQEPLAQ